MATIKDIARLSGYSIGTVSRVINHHSEVSQDAKEKILAVVKETGYTPNENAKRLKQTTHSAITILVKGAKNIFLNALLEHVQKQLEEYREEAKVIFLKETENEVKAALIANRDNHPKAFIFLGADLYNFQTEFSSIRVPSLMLAVNGSQLPFENLSSYYTDDKEGSYEAASQLIRLGHTRIGIIGGLFSSMEDQVSTARIYGAVKALKDHGIMFDENVQHVASQFTLEEGYRSAIELFAKFEGVSAIFALSDLLAIGAMRAIHEVGFRVPEDISIIGYDGIDYTRYSHPRIMTICQDIEKMAKDGVEDLMMRLAGDHPSGHVSIPYHVINWESVKKYKE